MRMGHPRLAGWTYVVDDKEREYHFERDNDATGHSTIACHINIYIPLGIINVELKLPNEKRHRVISG